MKIQVIETLFFNILIYSFLIPVLVFVTIVNKLKTRRIVLGIVIYSLIFFTFLFFDEYLSAHFRKIYTTTYTTLEYSFYAFFIYLLIQNKKARVAIFILSIAFIIFQLLYFFFAKVRTLDSVPIGIETILILTYIVILFFEQFKKTSVDYIYTKPWFALIIGIMIYLACSFFFNIMANSVGKKVMNPYWFITYIFETVKNILFAFSVFQYSKISDSKINTAASVPFLDLDIT